MNQRAVVHMRRTVRWTTLGRNVLLLALSGVVLSLPLPRSVLLAPIVGLLALGSSALVASWSARRLRVRVPPARTVTTGESFFFDLEIEQNQRLAHLRDAVVRIANSPLVQARPAGFCAAPNRRGWTAVPCRWRLARRGRTERVYATISTTQPLGLFECSVMFELDVDWLALPALGTVRQLEAPRPLRSTFRSAARFTTAGDEEFHALREAREGDSPHLVHWRSSARRSRLVVRELRSVARPPIEVVLFANTPSPPLPDGIHAGFERAVCIAATVVELFVRAERHVRFVFVGRGGFELDVRPTTRALYTLLGRLALVQPSVGVARRARSSARDAIVIGAGLPPSLTNDSTSNACATVIDAERADSRRYFSPRRARSTTAEFTTP